MSQNGHFFSKNVEKMSPQNYENRVLLRENDFCEKWQSGRINFFWGGFSTFMVYALSLTHPDVSSLANCWASPNNSPEKKREDNYIQRKKSNIIYMRTTIFSHDVQKV